MRRRFREATQKILPVHTHALKDTDPGPTGTDCCLLAARTGTRTHTVVGADVDCAKPSCWTEDRRRSRSSQSLLETSLGVSVGQDQATTVELHCFLKCHVVAVVVGLGPLEHFEWGSVEDSSTIFIFLLNRARRTTKILVCRRPSAHFALCYTFLFVLVFAQSSLGRVTCFVLRVASFPLGHAGSFSFCGSFRLSHAETGDWCQQCGHDPTGKTHCSRSRAGGDPHPRGDSTS